MSLNTTDRQIDRPAVRVALFNNVNIRILVQNTKYKHEHESDMADILTGIGIYGHFRPDRPLVWTRPEIPLAKLINQDHSSCS